MINRPRRRSGALLSAFAGLMLLAWLGMVFVARALAADPGVQVRLAALNPSNESAVVKGFDAPLSFLRIAAADLAADSSAGDRRRSGAVPRTSGRTGG